MAKGSNFFVKGALQALMMLVLVVAGWAAPEQAIAAPDNLSVAQALDASSRQLRTPTPEALDRPMASRCAVTRKESFELSKFREGHSAADDNSSTDAFAILIHTRLAGAGPVQTSQPFQENCSTETADAAAFQSRAPPSLIHC